MRRPSPILAVSAGIASALALGLYVTSVAASPGKESSAVIPGPAVQFTHSVVGDALKIKYSVTNKSASPIFIFDRIWDLKAEALDPDWAYVDVAGARAVVKRELGRLPNGLMFENPPVPYAREVPPGGRASGTARLLLPLSPRGPYGHIVEPKEPAGGDIRELVLRIGWCPKPAPKSLPPGAKPVTLGGEDLWLFPYGTVEAIQRGAESAPRRARLGRASDSRRGTPGMEHGQRPGRAPGSGP